MTITISWSHIKSIWNLFNCYCFVVPAFLNILWILSTQGQLKNCSILTPPTSSAWAVIPFLPGMKNCQSRKSPGSLGFGHSQWSHLSQTPASSVSVSFFLVSQTIDRVVPIYSACWKVSHVTFTLNRTYRATKELKVMDFWILISFQSIELKWTCSLKQFFLHFQIQYFAALSQGWSSATLALWIHLLFQFVYNLLNQFSH